MSDPHDNRDPAHLGLPPSLTPSSYAAPPEPAKPRGPMSDASKDAAARMYVSGVPLTTIAAVVGRSPSALYHALQNDLAGKVEEVRGLVLRETATHYFEMLSMLPQARVAIQGGIVSPNEDTRIETARWLIETVVPKPPQRQELHLSGGVALDVSTLLTDINTKMATLVEANPGGRAAALARVRTGPDALPRPTLPSTGDGDAA